MAPKKIGISVGDINGISLEIIFKALKRPELFQYMTPVIYASNQVVDAYRETVHGSISYKGLTSSEKLQEGKLNVVNCWSEDVVISPGQLSPSSGKYALLSLEYAVSDLKNRRIDALVTAPFNKEAVRAAGFKFPGHTEYLAEQFGSNQQLMLMVYDDLRVGVVTGHIPLAQVAQKITKAEVERKIRHMNESLRQDFGMERPTIAVLGLNPHAGDNGVIGQEDQKIVRPAIEACKRDGILAMGPYPADGLFGQGGYRKFDGILAMYHDQGLIPFKTIASGRGVNFTAGLPVVRTSPDHGTAYDIAGKNKADSSSFRQALYLALDVLKQRHEFLAIEH